jgi:hypothetical protein
MMTSIFKKMSVALALVGALGAANATVVPVNLGKLDDTLTYSHTSIKGAFDDVLYFQAATLLGGSFDINGLVRGVLTGTYSFGVGDSYDSVTWLLTDSLGTLDGVELFSSADFPVLESGKTYWLEIQGSMSRGNFNVNLMPSEIPEPGSMALVMLGVGALGVVARRRKVLANKMGA